MLNKLQSARVGRIVGPPERQARASGGWTITPFTAVLVCIALSACQTYPSRATSSVSCSAAIKAFSAHKALLMTGFFEGLDEMLYGYYAHEGIELVWPAAKPFTEYDDAARADPEILFNLVKETLQRAKGIELVYFQGAINSGPIVNKIETELGLPVVTSATANYWYLLSRLGKTYKIQGAERLLSEWRALKS